MTYLTLLARISRTFSDIYGKHRSLYPIHPKDPRLPTLSPTPNLSFNALAEEDSGSPIPLSVRLPSSVHVSTDSPARSDRAWAPHSERTQETLSVPSASRHGQLSDDDDAGEEEDESFEEIGGFVVVESPSSSAPGTPKKGSSREVVARLHQPLRRRDLECTAEGQWLR